MLPSLRPSTVLGPALAAVAMFAVAACGGSGDPGAGATTGGADTGRAPAPPPLSAVAADGWSAVSIAEGIKPALALGPDGSPGVVYLREDVQHGLVAFAAAADGWTPETVDEGYFYGPIDLAFAPDGRPHVVWHDHEGQEFDPRRGNLVLAARTEGDWEVESVRDDGHDGWDSTLALAGDGTLYLAGIDPVQFGSDDGVEVFQREGPGWNAASIGSGALQYQFNVSLALDAEGRPALTYYDDKARDLVFARQDDGAWRLETVVAKGDAGKFSSLAFDGEGRPHVSFLQQAGESSAVVRYAVLERGSWRIEDVAELDDLRLGENGARRTTSLALDPAGSPVIAFSDRTALRLATRAGDGWEVADVVTAGDRPLGQLADLALDGAGTPHIAFYEVTGEDPFTGLVGYVKAGS